jgi:ribosomal protein S18 acetylase RimI-like enzyme
MNDAHVLAPADLNFIEFNRHGARTTHGGLVHEEAGLVIFRPGHRFPVGFTGVFRTDPSLAPSEAIRRAREFFAPLDQGYTHVLMLHRDPDLAMALEASGATAFSRSPGMVCERRLSDMPMPPGVVLERVVDARGVRSFGEIAGMAYATMGMPPKIGPRHFADDASLLQPDIFAFVARLDGVPIGTAMCLVSHGVAGIYWVGTVPEARRRGIGEACTRAATNAGFDAGARFAALQASAMGEPIYRRMGFREVTRYPWYVIMP